MAKETVLVGCRLPNGIILTHPKDPKQTVKIAGTYQPMTDSGIHYPPRPYATTEVDAEFWSAWKAAYTGYPPLKTRAIFEARNEQEAAAKARELEKEKTGLEGLPKSMVIDGMKLEKAEI
jgi:hypothetical protein